MEQTIPPRPDNDLYASQPWLPAGMNDYAPVARPTHVGRSESATPTMPTAPAPFVSQRPFRSGSLQAREGNETHKKRRAALFYAVMCGGIVLVCLLLVLSSVGGISRLLPYPATSSTPGGNTRSGALASRATPVPTTPGASKIIFMPSSGGTNVSPTSTLVPAPSSTPAVGTTPAPTTDTTPVATATSTPTPVPSPTPVSGGTGTVTPILDCVVPSIGPGYLAYFGYTNSRSSAVTLAVGPKNHFVGVPPDEGQPTNFSPGTQTFAVTVHSPGRPVAWVLDGAQAVATANSKPCF